MTSSEHQSQDLREQARSLIGEGYERASIVDRARADELVELYRELGQEVVVLPGAVPEQGQECDTCLGLRFFNPARIRSGVIGSSVTRTPVAS